MNAPRAVRLRIVAPSALKQGSHAWSRLTERVPWSRHEFWFSLIRLIIVLGIVAAAARFLAIAYAPQSSALSRQLNCPSDVVPDREMVVSPQALAPTAQPATCAISDGIVLDMSDRRIADNPGQRRLNVKEKGHRSEGQKPPTLSQSEISPKRAPRRDLTNPSGAAANRQTSRAPRPMPAQAAIFPSPFGEMHGQ
jgi:hypothetical protein